MDKPSVFRSAPGVLSSLAALFLAGCSDGGDVTGADTDPGPEPAISVALGSTTLAVTQGQEDSVAVTVSRAGGYAGAVALSLEGAPNGVTGTFEPASVPGGSTASMLRLSASDQIEPGTYNLTVRASGTGVSEQTAALAVTVREAEGFAVSVEPTSLSVMQGASESATVTLTRYGDFAGAVSLDVGGAPTGLEVEVEPATVTGTSSTLTVTAAAELAAGSYPLTVQATGEIDGQTRQEGATLTVTVAESGSAGYTLLLDPDSLEVVLGGSGVATVNLGRTNFTGEVALAASGVPSGVAATFDPASASGNSATLSLDVGAGTAPGTYSLTVSGQADGLEDRTATLQLTVREAEGFAVSVEPTSLSVMQGASESATVTLTRYGDFAGAVSLDVGGAPAGLEVEVEPATVTGTSSTLTVTAAAELTAGSYPLTVQATAEIDGQTRQEGATLTVTVSKSGDCPGSLTNGDNHLCAITVPEQLHEWTFTADAGDWVALSVSQVEGDIQPWIRLVSPTGEELGSGSGGTVNQIDLNAPQAGTYTVIIGSRTSAGVLTGTGDYLLRLAQVPGGFVVPAGDEGGALTLGADHAGFISLGDLDMWTFSASQGDSIHVTIIRVEGDIQPWIRLVAETGEMLESRSGGSSNEITLAAPLSGSYTVIVGSRSSAGVLTGTGDYLLTVTLTGG